MDVEHGIACHNSAPDTTVAALFVDRLGPYAKMAGVDAWFLPRDAREYAGPHPVVAHPPCGPWSSLRHLYRGAEHDCGPRAVEQVRAYGGVLEQPAGSRLWKHCGLPIPFEAGEFGERDYDGWGFSIQVQQVSWGHVARKKTWLYLAGVDVNAMARTRLYGGEPTHWCSGGGTGRGKTPPGIKVCSAQQRRRTPPAFAEWLVMLARSVQQLPLAKAGAR
jgi:hypothetical protein